MAVQSLAVRGISVQEGEFNWCVKLALDLTQSQLLKRCDRVFLVWYFVSAVLTIFFLFWFNRLFASLVTYGIRAYIWHYYRVHVELQALQVSLLAGRVFFKYIRYHGQNETIIVHDGHVTWRYWLRRVQESECQYQRPRAPARPQEGRSDNDDAVKDDASRVEGVGEKESKSLPCRVLLEARGVEWFVYNRSPAYDTIFRNMRDADVVNYKEAKPASSETSKCSNHTDSTVSEEKQRSPRSNQEHQDQGGAGFLSDEKSSSNSVGSSVSDVETPGPEFPWFLNLFPIGLKCNKGALVMGNRNTRSILTIKFESAAGVINAKESSNFDLYRQAFDFDFVHPVVQFKHNKGYTQSQSNEGADLHAEKQQHIKSKLLWSGFLGHVGRVRHTLTSLHDYFPYRRGSVESLNHRHPKSAGTSRLADDNRGAYGQYRWLGLSRYLNEDDDQVEQERWKGIEYGQFPTILDSPKVSMSFYWDVPGVVPDSSGSSHKASHDAQRNINGDPPPEYGIDFKVCGGVMQYGPWADRQRSDLQAVFFPALYKDAVPAMKLAPGENRVSTSLNIRLELEEQTTLRMPTKEESKDWRWRGHKMPSTVNKDSNKKTKHHMKGSKKKASGQPFEVRPPGWLDVKILPDSAIRFAVDLVAGKDGYHNLVDLDLKGLEISSSVNHALLWRSRCQTISCDLSNPLAWNGLHQWRVAVRDSGMELFILRDHMFLLTDLISDWTSGPAGEYHTFVPFEYSISSYFQDFRMYLNANDSNIINNPADFDDNTFIIVGGSHLDANLVVPTKIFRPTRSSVTFKVDVSDGGLRLNTPPRNTQHTFLSDPGIASLKDLHIQGSYNYYTNTSPALTDILLMDVHGVSLGLHLHGFLIRYFMKIKDNYFGEDVHFRTLEEYQALIDRISNQEAKDMVAVPHNRISNDLDVILGLKAENVTTYLPVHLYSCDDNVRLEILSASSDLRITNYYMDFELSSTPIAVSHTSPLERSQHDLELYSNTQAFIDGIQVFGHRLFGLPPTEPTYVCNWDFDVGALTGECSSDFLRCLLFALRCFGSAFDDSENVLPPVHLETIPDITFLRARVLKISIGIHLEEAAFLLCAGKISFNFNDWGDVLLSDRLHLVIPDVTLAIVDVETAPMCKTISSSNPISHFLLQTTIELHKVSRAEKLNEKRQLQQSHLALHDSRTHRVPWLVHRDDARSGQLTSNHMNHSRPPAMPFPFMPEPFSAKVHVGFGEISSSSTSTASGPSMKESLRKSSFFIDNVSNQKKHSMRSAAKENQRPKVRFGQSAGRESLTERTTINKSGDVFIKKRTMSPAACSHSSLSFSSPFKKPHFPLLATELETSILPGLPAYVAADLPTNDLDAFEGLLTQISSEEIEQSSFILKLRSGLQAFCTPKALCSLMDMISCLQANDISSLLDDLQIDGVNEALRAGKKHEKESSMLDVCLHIPCVAIRFVNTGQSGSNETSALDQYDTTLSHFTTIAARSSKASRNAATNQSTNLLIHVLLSQATCSAVDLSGGKANNQAMLSLSIRDSVFWMKYGDTVTAELQFEELKIVSESRRVDYISSLLDHTTALVSNLTARFAVLGGAQNVRLRKFMLLLSTNDSDIPDPPFLTRASYVLRSASNHLRSNDSWKLISRLRYIYACLSKESQRKIQSHCQDTSTSCPEDAAERATSNLSRWQIWDLTQVKSCILLQKVYHELRDPRKRRSALLLPIRAALKSGAVRALIEPGPRQNDISLKGLIIGLALNQPLVPRNGSLNGDSTAFSSTVHIHCVEIAVCLNWLLLELLEDILGNIRTVTQPQVQEQRETHKYQTSSISRRLHLLVSSKLITIECDTPNMNVVSNCYSLEISSLHSGSGILGGSSSVSILFNADSATSEIRSHSILLTSYTLQQPRVFGTKASGSSQDVEESWRLIGSGHQVIFQFLANPLQLVEATDCFLESEVAHLFNWMKTIQPSQVQSEPQVQNAKKLGLRDVQIALFLDSYLLSAAILPSLTYQISGARVRSFVKSGRHGNNNLAVDFDLNEHSHTFVANGQGDENLNVLSSLQMPPIDGQLSLELASSQKSIDFSCLVEDVIFDASAVHAIFTTINRPEIIKLGTSINHEVSLLQSHYEHIFEAVGTNHRPAPSQLVLYKGVVSLKSLGLHARTSDSISVAGRAELQFKMDHMHLKVTNRDADSKTALKFAELELQLKGISLDILRLDDVHQHPCGHLTIQAEMRSTSKFNDVGRLVRFHQIRSSGLQVNVFAETAPVIVAILVHLHDTLKGVDFSYEVQNLKKLGRTRLWSENPDQAIEYQAQGDDNRPALFNAMYSLEMTDIFITWRTEGSVSLSPNREPEDLMLSFTKIDLATKKDNAARLLIENLRVQMMPTSTMSTARSSNSALMPEVLFNVAYVSTAQDRRLAFQVIGKSLDIRLTSQFILPMSDLRHSIALSIQRVRTATATWTASTPVSDGQAKPLVSNKKLASLLVDADFAGAVVHVQGRSVADPHLAVANVLRGGRLPQHGRYNQFSSESGGNSSTTLRAPGIAFKVEYKNAESGGQSLNAEMKVDASSNILYPTVVPLIMEISSTVKDIVAEPKEQHSSNKSSLSQTKFLEDERLRGGDPAAIFGNCKLNLGLRICRQEFSLSCQPIARVAATAQFEDIYITVNTIQSHEHGKSFAISGAFTRLQASVQHVYSRESTGSFEVDSVVVSLMNSRHVSAVDGISAILSVSPMKAQINGKQSQDFLLFREIWVPPEIRRTSPSAVPLPPLESHAFIVQRYQQMAATSSFPWNATVSIAELEVQVDLGQSVGRSVFTISKCWMSSKKSSNWEQNLCLGFDSMAVDSTGRMSGFVELRDLRLRASIEWPTTKETQNQTPLVQASLAFERLCVKAAFDYQAFAVANITTLEFLMYNVRDLQSASRDRLVGVLDGDKLQMFCTTTSASQIIALYQAFQRLYQEKLAAYQTSLRDIEKFLRRKSSVNPSITPAAMKQEGSSVSSVRSSLKLQTDVVVTIKAVSLGTFPSTFLDNQIFKLEALDTSVRFAVFLEADRIHSTLGMNLGQLRIALSGITRDNVPKTLGDISVAEVVDCATGSRGGTILKVPKLIASMETWHSPASTNIDYIFKSSFQGRVDVGWNYSRISYIRGMWARHARALAHRLGKPLPQSAVQISGGPLSGDGDGNGDGNQIDMAGERAKITAVVNVPQSKYRYTALQPPIIETPQLRDMGEATPPLEWIGLHRDRLPNLTHQIVIVTLLEVAREVDDAYSKILGSS